MRIFLKYTAVISVLAIRLSAFMSCGILKRFIENESEALSEDESITESEKATESTASETESESESATETESESESSFAEGVIPLEAPVVIADGENVYFKPVRPSENNDVFASCVSELRKPAEGFSLSFGVAKESDNDNTDGEILIGNTCRPQSKAEMNKLGYDDFSITYVDNKIVVAAHTAERLAEAVTFLKENLLRVNEGRLEYIGNYVYESDDALWLEDGESFADYRIVLGHDELYMTAYNLQQYINSKYGVKPDIIFGDRAQKEGKEIVLGNVESREISALADGL